MSAFAQQPTGFINRTVTRGGNVRRYVLYVPADYDPAKTWPLIVFLHGAGERGDDGLIQSEVGLGSAIRRNPERYPALVLMPQCPPDRVWDAALPDVEAAMATTQQEFNVDTRRIYLTGLSMGGYATWIWGATKTGVFAALMPICGGGIMEDLKDLSKEDLAGNYGTPEHRIQQLATVPIYAFHGAKDTAVPVERSRQMVELVKAAGGDVQYTEFPEAAHNSWDDAYRDEKTIKWLLRQSK